MNLDLLRKMVKKGYVKEIKHDKHDLFLYNYTPKTQYDSFWNEVTLQCRGLILDKKGNKIAVPFKKFFNIEELDNIPKLNFDVFEKMDGSLGIMYFANDKPFIATRGSFNSEQSQKANELLYTKYNYLFEKLDKSKTYLFEIIYPSNKIVVNYNGIEDLFLIAIIDNKTGNDCKIEEIGFPIVKKYDGIKDINELKNLNTENKEGFVIRFENGFRVKIKFSDYIRLHRLITQFSNVSIWDCLKNNDDINQLLKNVPDEFYEWVKITKIDLEKKFETIETECKKVFKILETRKQTALYFKSQKYPKVLFSMLDNRDYSDLIWKIIKPNFKKPYRL